MLNISNKGRALAKVKGGKYNGEILFLDTEEKCEDENECCCKCRICSIKCIKNPCCKKCKQYTKNFIDYYEKYFVINDGILLPLTKEHERSVDYISGPSGSGKSHYAADLARSFQFMHPDKDIYIFSRTEPKNDPAFKKINFIPIPIDDSIVTDPIDITRELTRGCLVIFDDCNTIIDDKQKKAVDNLMSDIMEVGRKLDIWIIITNHLVNPNEKKLGRTIMNEMQTFTFFPKSGSAHQIKYCLQKYFGLSNKQITAILNLPSRWVTIHKNFPLTVMYDKGAFLFN